MVAGLAVIDILMPGCRSLKEKRGVLKRVLKRTQNEFNVSIAEVGDNDQWKRARIGFCVVGNEKQYINAKMDHILDFIDSLHVAEIVKSKMEIMSMDDLLDPWEGNVEKYDEF
ncbi:MAG: DUF503 domain-containing protein [Syntrophales bacterium]|jgi:uncharacterized protein YlxP (DUF503 family)|nr:DUF503 domain-containing protein [Syntrophales bacterium]